MNTIEMNAPKYRRAGYEERAAAKRAKQRAYNAEHREHQREYARAWNAAHVEHVRARKKAYRVANRDRLATTERARRARRRAEEPERLIAQDRSWTLRKYGLALADYDALLVRQGGVCAACGRPEVIRHPNSTLPGADSLSVDHDHETRMARGLLCRACNRALGLLGDDPERLAALLAYRRSYP